jgi:hypothetical protein
MMNEKSGSLCQFSQDSGESQVWEGAQKNAWQIISTPE